MNFKVIFRKLIRISEGFVKVMEQSGIGQNFLARSKDVEQLSFFKDNQNKV